MRDNKRHGNYLIAKVNTPPEYMPFRLVDRISVALWLMGIEPIKYYPSFSLHIEKEIMRIKSLDEPQRTEQAVRILRRYVDAETLVKAAAKMQSPDAETDRRLRKSEKLKHQITDTLGLTTRQTRSRPVPAQDDRSHSSDRSRRPRRT